MAPRDKVMRDMPPPQAHMKGGGQRGGPRRWTGTGPRPARHIPWPEIFKHHQSVVSGHLKMLDMVRKHTVEGSGNYRTIVPMIDRCKEMLAQFRQVTNSFVPPKSSFEAVPLGSSSASMYPGYSPADHIYGEAAEEYGREFSRAHKEGRAPQLDPTKGPEYVVGHSRQTMQKQLDELHKNGRENGGNQGDEKATWSRDHPPEPKPTATEDKKEGKEATLPAEGDNPYFIIDTNPTPINIPDRTTTTATSHHKPKKQKIKHVSSVNDVPVVEAEDISAEVEARMKEREQKHKKKKDKKRKRESGDSTIVSDEKSESATKDQPAGEDDASVEKPKKKKSKKEQATTDEAEMAVSNDTTEENNTGMEKKSKKDKKKEKKRAADHTGDPDAVNDGDRDGESGKKKKRKKHHD